MIYVGRQDVHMEFDMGSATRALSDTGRKADGLGMKPYLSFGALKVHGCGKRADGQL